MSIIPSIIQFPSVDLSNTFGAIMLGIFVSFSLWGAICLQSFMYFINYPLDRWPLRWLVAFLLILDTAHQGLLIASVWPPLISHYGDYELLADLPNKPMSYQILLTGVAAFAAQGFFTWRVYIFSGRKVLWPLVVVPIATIALAVNCVATWALRSDAVVDPRLSLKLGYANCSLLVALDLCLSIAMVILLRKSKTGAQRTDRTIYRLIIMTFASGGWSTLLATVILVVLSHAPTSAIYFALELPACSLYCNTVLANLNTRNYMSGTSSTTAAQHFESSGDAVELSSVVVFKTKTVEVRMDGNDSTSTAAQGQYGADGVVSPRMAGYLS